MAVAVGSAVGVGDVVAGAVGDKVGVGVADDGTVGVNVGVTVTVGAVVGKGMVVTSGSTVGAVVAVGAMVGVWMSVTAVVSVSGVVSSTLDVGGVVRVTNGVFVAVTVRGAGVNGERNQGNTRGRASAPLMTKPINPISARIPTQDQMLRRGWGLFSLTRVGFLCDGVVDRSVPNPNRRRLPKAPRTSSTSWKRSATFSCIARRITRSVA